MTKQQESNRNSKHKLRYGMEKGQYARMYAAQEGKCKSCKVWFPVLCVDHDHATGRVRDLLCQRCNPMIGMAQDSTERLRCGIAYLESHQEQRQCLKNSVRNASSSICHLTLVLPLNSVPPAGTSSAERLPAPQLNDQTLPLPLVWTSR